MVKPVASVEPWTPPAEFAVPPYTRNPFYEDAERRVRLVLPELELSADLLSVIDLVLHETRTAARRAYDRAADAREGERS